MWPEAEEYHIIQKHSRKSAGMFPGEDDVRISAVCFPCSGKAGHECGYAKDGEHAEGDQVFVALVGV